MLCHRRAGCDRIDCDCLAKAKGDRGSSLVGVNGDVVLARRTGLPSRNMDADVSLWGTSLLLRLFAVVEPGYVARCDLKKPGAKPWVDYPVCELQRPKRGNVGPIGLDRLLAIIPGASPWAIRRAVGANGPPRRTVFAFRSCVFCLPPLTPCRVRFKSSGGGA